MRADERKRAAPTQARLALAVLLALSIAHALALACRKQNGSR